MLKSIPKSRAGSTRSALFLLLTLALFLPFSLQPAPRAWAASHLYAGGGGGGGSSASGGAGGGGGAAAATQSDAPDDLLNGGTGADGYGATYPEGGGGAGGTGPSFLPQPAELAGNGALGGTNSANAAWNGQSAQGADGGEGGSITAQLGAISRGDTVYIYAGHGGNAGLAGAGGHGGSISLSASGNRTLDVLEIGGATAARPAAARPAAWAERRGSGWTAPLPSMAISACPAVRAAGPAALPWKSAL